MFRIVLSIFIALSCLFHVSAQTIYEEELKIKEAVFNLLEGIQNSDSTLIVKVLSPSASMSSIEERNGVTKMSSITYQQFVKAVGRPHTDEWKEEILAFDIQLHQSMATAWTPYIFYINGKPLHHGVNAFQLFKSNEGWKIIQVTDTRVKEGHDAFKQQYASPAKSIHKVMDAWHLAAAKADEDIFFGTMTEKGIYLGTDISERWDAKGMAKWAKPHFEKESAWSFTASDRELYFSADKKTVWFEEKLDTWMGDCRGSGVMLLTEEGWKLAHYHLAIAVPNDSVDGYLKLIGKERKKSK